MKYILVIILVFLSNKLESQILLAPTSLHFNETEVYANVILYNNSNTDKEISIQTKFGIPNSDSLGETTVNYNEVNNYLHKSIIEEDLKIFPKKFLINQGKKQVVRIMFTGASKYKNSFYWSRLVINSKPVNKSDVSFNSQEDIGTQLNFAFNQAIPITFRKGNIESKIKIENVLNDYMGNSLLCRFSIEDEAFFGSCQIKFYDKNDSLIANIDSPISMYQNGTKKIIYDSKIKESISYAKITLLTGRENLNKNLFPFYKEEEVTVLLN